MTKKTTEIKTREEVLNAGFIFAGTTDDYAMLEEIVRDYKIKGFEVWFTKIIDGHWSYWVRPI